MHKKLIFGLLILLASKSQAIITFQKTYGGNKWDNGYSVQQTIDGGYIIAGAIAEFGIGSYDVYLIKTDSLGDTLWTKTFGENGDDVAYSVHQLSDNGFIVTGTSKSYYDVYLVRTDSLGDTLWSKTFGGAGYDNGYSVQQTQDGGFIVAGETSSFGAGGYDAYLIKTDSLGDTIWTKTFGGGGDDAIRSLCQTPDSGFVMSGYTSSSTAGLRDVWMIKTDQSGNILWTKTIGGTQSDWGYSVQKTNDDGFIITGYTSSFGAGVYDVYLIKTNSSGDTLWTKAFGGTDYDRGFSVQQTKDSGFIIAGETHSFGAGDYDVYLIKTNSSGDTLWTKTFGGISLDESYSTWQTQDGGFIIVGETWSYGAGFADVYLIKTDSTGNVAVEESSNPQSPPPNPCFSISPNPFTTSTTIKLSTFNSQPLTLSIYDLSGRLIKSFNPINSKNSMNSITLDARDLRPGIYFVKMGESKPIKIIKLNKLK